MRVRGFFASFIIRFVLFLGLFLGSSTQSFANVGQEFGFGSRTAALGGAGVAWGFEGFSAYANPAGLSLEKEKRLFLSWGLIFVQPNFLAIDTIVTQNSFNADNASGSPTYGNVDNSYKATFGQELGIVYRLFPDFLNLSFGLTTFLPVNQAAYIDTGESYVPEYIMYRARTQRPQLDFGVGMDLGSGFHLGGGMHLGFTLTGNGKVFINAKAKTSSSMRFISSLKPKFSPYLGLLYTPPSDPKSYSLGAVFRLPVSSDASIQMTSSARVFGELAAVDFNFTSTSTLYYDPMAIELGGSWQHASSARIYAQVDYQFWSKYQAAALTILQPQTTKCTNPDGTACTTLQIQPGLTPAFTYVNILVPRVGEEIDLSETVTVRLGYAYRPSVISDLPSDSGNYLDPAKHLFNFGLGFNYQHFLNYEMPCHLDLNFAYQYLVARHITKTPGNESGDLNDSKIGSPGYDAGGNLLGGGVSLSLAF